MQLFIIHVLTTSFTRNNLVTQHKISFKSLDILDNRSNNNQKRRKWNKFTYKMFKALTSSGLEISRFAKNSGVSVLSV